jgi:hypothetical protein
MKINKILEIKKTCRFVLYYVLYFCLNFSYDDTTCSREKIHAHQLMDAIFSYALCREETQSV